MMGPSLIIENSIMSEAQVLETSGGRAIFRCPIQTVNEINQNKRMYPELVLKEGMGNCDDRMNRRAFYSELDHPLPTGNQQIDGIRQTTVALSNASHIIRGYDFEGSFLVGEMETLSTTKGGELFALLRDKTGVGFSMRGLAELEHLQDHNVVKSPLTVISFDAVSMPSHKSAVVDFNEMKFEQTALLETASGLICANGKCFMPDYFDKLIESKTIDFFERWI